MCTTVRRKSRDSLPRIRSKRVHKIVQLQLPNNDTHQRYHPGTTETTPNQSWGSAFKIYDTNFTSPRKYWELQKLSSAVISSAQPPSLPRGSLPMYVMTEYVWDIPYIFLMILIGARVTWLRVVLSFHSVNINAIWEFSRGSGQKYPNRPNGPTLISHGA